jgi:hypothetical protein
LVVYYKHFCSQNCLYLVTHDQLISKNNLTFLVMNMNTHRRLPSLLISIFIFSFSSMAQNETFDLMTFTPPSGWSKNLNSDVLMYAAPQNDSIYCLISIYKSTEGTGNISDDFLNSWNALAATRLNITEKPQSEKSPASDGWENQTGSASFSLHGSLSVAILTTISGYKKMMKWQLLRRMEIKNIKRMDLSFLPS